MSEEKSAPSSQSETQPVDPLKVSVDISDKVLQVRIGRPKRRNVANERGSAELARATSPDASSEEIQIDTQPYVRDGLKESDFADEESFARAISGIDWGEYDPEKIIEVIYKITEIISGVTFLPYQAPFVRRVIRAIIFNEGETITASWSRQSGKSVSIAAIAVALCTVMPALAKQFPDQLKIYKDGFAVGIFAPAAEQALRLYNKVQKFARSQTAFEVYDDEDFQIKLERYGCKWSNGSSVIAQSANPKSNIEGPSLHLCVAWDTVLTTPTGPCRISEIEVGDTVLSFDRGNLVWDKVIRKYVSGVKEVKLVTLTSGQSIRATADHKILTSLGWKTVAELRVEDTILIDGNNVQEQIDRTAYPGLLSRRYVDIISREGFCESTNISKAFSKAAGLCESEIRDTEIHVPVPSKDYGERGLGRAAISVYDPVLTRNSPLPNYVLSRGEESSYAGMAGATDRRRGGLLVHGRRKPRKECVNDSFARVLLRGALSDSEILSYEVWPESEDSDRSSERENSILNKILDRIIGYPLKNTGALGHRKPALQDSCGATSSRRVQNLWRQVLNKVEEAICLFKGFLQKSITRSAKGNLLCTPRCEGQGYGSPEIGGNARSSGRVSQSASRKGARLWEKVETGQQGQGLRKKEKIRSPQSREGSSLHAGMGASEARISSIEDVGEALTFDITTERFHNFLANGVVVHNCISDESQDLIGAVAAKSIEPMLSWTNGTMVYTGTAADDPNYFYDLKLSNSQFDLSRPEKFRTCYEYTYEEIIKHNPRYAKFVEQQIRKHGKESRAFQRAFLLRWGFEEGKAIPPSVLKEHTMYHRVPITHICDEPVIAGIDLARKRYGTVVTIAKVVRMDIIYEDDDASGAIKKNLPTAQICDWLELEDMPYPDQRPLMRAFLNQYSNVRLIVVDSTGIGDAVIEEMGREWDEYREILSPFLFSPKSKNQLMNLFYEFLYSRRLIIPSTDEARELTRWQKFFLQMVNIQKVSKAGYTFLSKALRESARDDFVDSLLLCLHGVQINSSRLGDDITLDSESIFTSPVSVNGTGIEAMRRRYQEGQSVSLSQRNARAQKLLGGIK